MANFLKCQGCAVSFDRTSHRLIIREVENGDWILYENLTVEMSNYFDERVAEIFAEKFTLWVFIGCTEREDDGLRIWQSLAESGCGVGENLPLVGPYISLVSHLPTVGRGNAWQSCWNKATELATEEMSGKINCGSLRVPTVLDTDTTVVVIEFSKWKA